MSRYGKPRIAYLAPGASAVARVECPAAHDQGDRRAYHDPVPLRPDQHVVEPETGKEMIGGEIVEAAPAESVHADRQFDLSYVLRGSVAPGYRGSTELLTRVDEGEDFATDACIRKDGFDPDGHRYLEEISFEVKNTQSEASLKKRARDLIRRGVRRVFAIYVELVKEPQGGPARCARPGGTPRPAAADPGTTSLARVTPISIARGWNDQSCVVLSGLYSSGVVAITRSALRTRTSLPSNATTRAWMGSAPAARSSFR